VGGLIALGRWIFVVTSLQNYMQGVPEKKCARAATSGQLTRDVYQLEKYLLSIGYKL